MTIYYQHQQTGERFEISKPKDGAFTLKGRGLVATVFVGPELGDRPYRVSIDGKPWAQAESPKSAAELACREIIQRAEFVARTVEELSAAMDDFYKTLE